MITAVGTVSVFVSDQDRAKAFYLDKLGFELHDDQPYGPDMRWVSVAPKGAQTEVILYKPDANWEHHRQVVGKSQALTLNMRDLSTYVAGLKAKGVHVVQEPTTEFWGTYAIILDSEDNSLILSEEPKPQG